MPYKHRGQIQVDKRTREELRLAANNSRIEFESWDHIIRWATEQLEDVA